MANSLIHIAASLSSAIEARLFAEYGAIFVTRATAPPAIIFSSADEVELFQSSLVTSRATFGEHEIELQTEALDALVSAASEVADRGGRLTARAADAGRRSFEDTVGLWNRNVARGLDHWQSLGRITADRAQAIRELAPANQVAVILGMEENEQLYFGTFLDRSILYSVAAPGASQHLSMLAFDVAEYKDDTVEQALASFGWFRTVINDLPHFTYLGHKENALPHLGLKRVVIDYDSHSYSFRVPDLQSLS